MPRRLRVNRFVFGLLIPALALTGPAEAELAKPDRKAAKKMLSEGTLYARIDIPCETGRHPFGTYLAPLVEVSPEGTNTDGDLGFNTSFWHAGSTFWAIAPNDPMEFDELEFDASEVEIELVGIGPAKGNNTVIKFVQIHTLEDFEQAFDLAFSRVPLQEEHPGWPQEIRDAIAERRLMDGMTKRQVYYVVGAPERHETFEEGGQKIEMWHLRQDRGTKIGFWTAREKRTDNPGRLRFVDGALTEGYGSTGLDLDD